MDPGRELLSLIAGRVAKGANHYAAQREVFAAHPGLVAQWHRGEGQDEPETTRRRDIELAEVDPGHALLSLATAYERAGLPRERAVRLALDRHPQVAAAYHRGELIPKAPPRPRLPASGGLRRLQSDDARQLREGETMLHRLAAGPEGGFFAIMGA